MGDFEHVTTSSPQEEGSLADRALAEGVSLLVAVGGDGTWSHVADRIVASGRDDVSLGLLAAGTGNDFAKSFGMTHRDPEAMVAALGRGRTMKVDVGRIVSPWRPSEPGVRSKPAETTTAEPDGVRRPRAPRHFLNVLGFGFDVAVVDASQGARFLRGDALYQITALQQLFAFPGLPLELTTRGDTVASGRHLMLTISNGRIFGGSFPIAPRAELQDGLLDACAIRDAGALTRARLFGMVARGNHEASPFVRPRQSDRFVVRFEEPVRYEVDGDIHASMTNEVEIEVVPRALRVVVP